MISRTILAAGVSTVSSGPAPAGAAGRTAARPDVFSSATAAAADLLRAGAGAGCAQNAAQAAVEKMASTLAAIAGSSDLESAIAKLLQVQSKRTRSAVKDAEGTIKTNYLRMKDQTENKLKAIEDRINAEKDKGFWDKLVTFFDSAFKVASATVAGCAGGTIGMIAAAFLISSVIVSNTVRSDVGGWTAATAGAAGGLLLPSASSIVMGEAMKYTQQAMHYVRSGVAIPQASAEKDKLRAQAEIADIDTDKAKAQDSNERSRDQLKQGLDQANRSLRLVTRLIESRSRAVEAAI